MGMTDIEKLICLKKHFTGHSTIQYAVGIAEHEDDLQRRVEGIILR